MKHVYDIAIIGAGPGGIAAIVEANILGYKNVLLLEKEELHSSTIRKFYKENKRVDKNWNDQIVEVLGNIDFKDCTKEEAIDLFGICMREAMVDYFPYIEVERINKIGTGDFCILTVKNREYYAKNIIVATGRMGKPNKPSYKLPESLKEILNFNIDNCTQNENILVVGGGNSAIEYALDICSSNEVTLSYRQQAFTRLNARNLLDLKHAVEGNKIRELLGSSIINVEDENGKVKVSFQEQESKVFDRIIYAIGGTSPADFLKRSNVLVDKFGVPQLSECHETNIHNFYVAGDVGFKNGGSIALAMNMSYKILHDINSKTLEK